MPTESNTGSDLGPNTPKRPLLAIKGKGGTRFSTPHETPRERMARVVKAGKKQPKHKEK